MTTLLNVPTVWPFSGYHIVPANLMPSGRAYVATNGQVVAQSQDVPLLVYGYGFSVEYNTAGTLIGSETVTVNGNQESTTQAIADLGGGLVLERTVSLTSSDLLSLNSAPPVLVPAPGAGKVLLPLAAVWKYTFGTTPYASSKAFVVIWDGIVITSPPRGGLIDPSFHFSNPFFTGVQSDWGISWAGGEVNNGNAVSNNFNWFEGVDPSNKALTLYSAADMTGGDGTCEAVISYMVVTL